MKEKSLLDSELWHACAGGMVKIPGVNSKVFYFPQGHAEHTLLLNSSSSSSSVDLNLKGLGNGNRIPSFILCRVAHVTYLADSDTDEVYARINLVPDPLPLPVNQSDDDAVVLLGSDSDDNNNNNKPPASFAKTLTQSDANNGGGFSVPRYCAETIFPRLDYSADPPVQNVVARDVHGVTWKFRHIYRGTPRRHLLTTGWSTFVNHKKLVAGDSIVFFRAHNGDLCVGIRRAKRGGGGVVNDDRWASNKLLLQPGKAVKPHAVVEAAFLAANGQPFQVLYYPRASTPEFCVKASSVTAAMRIHWCSGMRFKMPFETEDSSRISWFMGTVASVQVSDPVRWPNSPWRLLQVTWDEPDLLHNVKCVNPWLVEMVSNMPVIHLSPFSPPRKKLRLPHHPDFSLLDGQFSMPSFSGNPLGPSSPISCLSDNIPAGIQGARHAQIGVPLLDLHPSNKLQMGLLPPSFMRGDPRMKIPDSMAKTHADDIDNISCLLTIGNSNQNPGKTAVAKTPLFILFGQPILTEQQMSNDSLSSLAVGKSSPGGGTQLRTETFAHDRHDLLPKNFPDAQCFWKPGGYSSQDLGLDTGHCKVFLESEDIGRILDLSVLGSYEELYRRLGHMFGIEVTELLSHVFYRDLTGVVKQIGDEPFSEFMKTAKRLTILMKPSSNSAERKLITGLPTGERGLDSSNQAGPLSIFA